MNALAYRQQLQALLPPGDAWPRDDDAELTELCDAIAETFARAEQRIDDLIEEDDPRTTDELLPEWESELGLPGPCFAPTTIEGRRAAVIARELEQTELINEQHYIDLAAAVGYAATITYYTPFDCMSGCTDPVTGDAWLSAFDVNAVSQPANDAQLQCVINNNAPIWTTPIFKLT